MPASTLSTLPLNTFSLRSLTLVRHAQPLVEAGVCYGALDVAADLHATQTAALALANTLPAHAQVWSSTLQRCEQLTQCLRGLRPDLTCQTDARLCEMNFGAWEGQRWSDIAPSELAAWTDDFWHYQAGGGESVAQVMARVSSAWDDMAKPSAGQSPVWVTHAGVIRAASLWARGVRVVGLATDWPQSAPAFGQWTQLALPFRLRTASP